jgi:hypothetical protein
MDILLITERIWFCNEYEAVPFQSYSKLWFCREGSHGCRSGATLSPLWPHMGLSHKLSITGMVTGSRKPKCSSATLSTTNPTWSDLRMNPKQCIQHKLSSHKRGPYQLAQSARSWNRLSHVYRYQYSCEQNDQTGWENREICRRGRCNS